MSNERPHYRLWCASAHDTFCNTVYSLVSGDHDDVIKWKHFPRNLPFVRGIHRSRWIPTQRPVTRSFDVFFDLRLNKRLSKQPWGWWFETPSWSLWRHCNDIVLLTRFGTWWCPEIETLCITDNLWGDCLRVINGFPSQRASESNICCFVYHQAVEQTFVPCDLRRHSTNVISRHATLRILSECAFGICPTTF